jgi:hypothetical protein
MREREGKGNPGLESTRAAAAAVGGVLAVPDFGDGRGEKDTDFNDLARGAGRDAVLECFREVLDANGYENTLPPGGEATPDIEERAPNGLDAAIATLAGMSTASYELARKDEAARLGVRASFLDKLVVAAGPRDDAALGQGRQLVLLEPDPWPEPVEGAVLLSELRNTIKKFLVCAVDRRDLVRACRASCADFKHSLAAAALRQNHAARSYQAALETAPCRVEHHGGGPVPHRREMLPDACYRRGGFFF